MVERLAILLVCCSQGSSGARPSCLAVQLDLLGWVVSFGGADGTAKCAGVGSSECHGMEARGGWVGRLCL
jgi:hypothetical protein